MKTKKFCLTENQMPTQWYNIVADMPNKPLPPLHPATKQPVTKEQMSAIFAEELIDQEMSAERFIDIPEEVQEIYKIWRPTPLVRATGLEKAHGSEGLWSKAMKAAREKGSLEGVIAAAKSKRYPRTRIQRLLLCAFLGITQEDLKRPVSHVRALAFDETGRGILRRMRETGELPIVNAGEKPEDGALYDLELRAGRLYPLFCRDDTIPDGNAEENLRIFLKK